MDTVTSYGSGESGSGHPPPHPTPPPPPFQDLRVQSTQLASGRTSDGRAAGGEGVARRRELVRGVSEHESVTSGEMSRRKVRLVGEGGAGRTQEN